MFGKGSAFLCLGTKFLSRPPFFSQSKERVGDDNYRIAVFGFGDSREYHPKQLVFET